MNCDNYPDCENEAVRRVSSVRYSRDPADELYFCESCARAYDDAEYRTARRLNLVGLARRLCFPNSRREDE